MCRLLATIIWLLAKHMCCIKCTYSHNDISCIYSPLPGVQTRDLIVGSTTKENYIMAGCIEQTTGFQLSFPHYFFVITGRGTNLILITDNSESVRIRHVTETYVVTRVTSVDSSYFLECCGWCVQFQYITMWLNKKPFLFHRDTCSWHSHHWRLLSPHTAAAVTQSCFPCVCWDSLV